jgi:hypothetical protein
MLGGSTETAMPITYPNGSLIPDPFAVPPGEIALRCAGFLAVRAGMDRWHRMLQAAPKPALQTGGTA